MLRNFWHELREQGLTDNPAPFRDWIRKYCGSQKQREKPGSAISSALRTSPRQVAWLLLKQPEESSRLYLEELSARVSGHARTG
jgi:hypothetical protein